MRVIVRIMTFVVLIVWSSGSRDVCSDLAGQCGSVLGSFVYILCSGIIYNSPAGYCSDDDAHLIS